jgi:hypothetical protein
MDCLVHRLEEQIAQQLATLIELLEKEPLDSLDDPWHERPSARSDRGGAEQSSAPSATLGRARTKTRAGSTGACPDHA